MTTTDDALAKAREIMRGETAKDTEAAPVNEFVLVRSGIKPKEHLTVMLHTPQFGELGIGVTGHWTGTEWVADDERDLSDVPPVHFMVIQFPSYQGNEEDWANVPLEDEADEEPVDESDDSLDSSSSSGE